MKRPVRVAGAVMTGGLLFWPAHAEGPVTNGLGGLNSQLMASTLKLHDVRTATDESTQQRLRRLAQYTEEEPQESDESAEGEASEESDEESADERTEEASSANETGASDSENDGSLYESDYSAPEGEPFVAGSEAGSEDLLGSGMANEASDGEQPDPTPATYAPEQGVTAAEAGGNDSRLKFKLSTGFDYSSGDYGLEEDTDILFIPVSGQLDTRSWKFKVTVPWIRIEGPTGVVGGLDGPIIVDGGAVPEEPAAEEPLPEEPVRTGPFVVTNSGLGDVVASVTYKIPPLGEGAPFIDLTGKVKFPTADRDKFLGTGEFDFTGQADIFQAFGDLTIFGTIGYRVLGDIDPTDANPDGRDLNNGVLAGGGVAYKFSDTFSGGGILDWREASTDTSDDPFEVVPYMVFKFEEVWALQAYGVFGLSDGSPDAGGGLQISVTFD